MFGNKKTLEVLPDEQILGYDKDNLKDYREMQEAEEVLKHAKDKGFRAPSKKALDKATQIVQDYRRKKAQTFLEEHKTRISYYGVEIKAYFDEEFLKQTGMIRPSLTIADFNPFKPIKNVKPWSEAMEENLATRINCTHELNEDETACKHCGLNPENWGTNNEGVTDEYQERQRAKIQEEKAKELACKNGQHEISEDGKICKNCRKPKEAWEEVKETDQTTSDNE